MSNAIEPGLYPSRIELSRSALQGNIKFLRDYIGRDTAFCSVIKGNAYGHGIRHFVPLAEECGVRHFAVFGADEAKDAIEASREGSAVQIMGMIANETLSWAIEHNISFYIFELNRLEAAVGAARAAGRPARIHLHLETGMNRLGLDRESLDRTVDIIRENRDHLIIEGVCTHYAGAESVSNHVRIQQQIERFGERADWLEEKGIVPKYRHTACSAAVLNYPETTMDMVRIGIAQYGLWPSRETYMHFVKRNNGMERAFTDPLKRVMSWKSVIMNTKKVEAGEFVGYGNVYLTSRDQLIAGVPIGYSQGFGRDLTNAGRVLVRGLRAPVAGLVNMNMLTVDVTDIEGVEKGDEVVIIGKQQEDEISVASFSEMTNYLNYEVLVRIPSLLPRYIVD